MTRQPLFTSGKPVLSDICEADSCYPLFQRTLGTVGRAAIAAVPGSCGELVQGNVGGFDFHITCPIDSYSVAVAWAAEEDGAILAVPGWKARRAIEIAFDLLGASSSSINVILRSTLPHGKGMASSSADITAVIAATGKFLGEELAAADIARIALEIEPTDGVFFPGVVSFDHAGGQSLKVLGDPPPIDIIIVDLGGSVDTLLFNRTKSDRSAGDEQLVAEAVSLVEAGIKEQRPDLIGKGATLSALANQRYLEKTELDSIVDKALDCGALGVAVAHSGTVVGILTDRGRLELVLASLGDGISKRVLGRSRLIGGGVFFESV